MKNKNYNFWQSQIINEQTYFDFYNRLVELSINMFEWVNLPDTCDERFLELSLLCNGCALFFQDEIDHRYLTLQTMLGGTMDVYNIPMERRAYAVGNSFNWVRNNEDSVIIWNNRLHQSSMKTLEQFATRLYEVQRAIDVNVKQQKTPTIFKGSEEQMFSLKQAYSKIEENIPVLMVDKTFNPEEMILYQTPAPFVADKLTDIMHSIWNNAYTYIGVESNGVDKKERLITDELDSNLATVEANRLTKLISRKDACNAINKMFGLDLDVRFRQITVKDGMTDRPSDIYDDGLYPAFSYNNADGSEDN